MIRNSQLFTLLPVMLTLILLSNAGCSSLGVLVTGGGGVPAPGPEQRPRSYPSYRSLKIPPGHLPPPGQCKLWYPGKPPGHQPPPTSCESALRSAGGNAWVLYRPANEPKMLEVKERKENQSRGEIVVRHYTID